MKNNEIPYEYGSDERIIAKKIMEAAENCYNRGIPVATDFLDLRALDVFSSISGLLPPVKYTLFGGYNLAERKLIQFVPYEDFYYEAPFDTVKIIPADRRFSEALSHRDYMGSIMGLSISREKFGDILLSDDGAVVFCVKKITGYLIENLTKVRNTFVQVIISDDIDPDFEPSYREITGTVASVRLDSIISLGFGISRNHAIPYIEGGKTTVNGRLITTNAYSINDNDIISVRSLGKMRFIGQASETRKGRIVVVIHKYQ